MHYWGDKKVNRLANKGAMASKARWEAYDTEVNLDAVLGSPEDLTHYQDCIAQARYEGGLQNAKAVRD